MKANELTMQNANEMYQMQNGRINEESIRHAIDILQVLHKAKEIDKNCLYTVRNTIIGLREMACNCNAYDVKELEGFIRWHEREIRIKESEVQSTRKNIHDTKRTLENVYIIAEMYYLIMDSCSQINAHKLILSIVRQIEIEVK